MSCINVTRSLWKIEKYTVQDLSKEVAMGYFVQIREDFKGHKQSKSF